MSYVSIFTNLSTIHGTNYHYHLYKYMMYNSIVVNCTLGSLFSKKQRPSSKEGLFVLKCI